MSESLKEQYASSALFGSNAADVEALYEQYLQNPDAVAEGWRRYFRSLANGQPGHEVAHSPIRQRLIQGLSGTGGNGAASATIIPKNIVAANEKQAAVSRMIQVYSLRGHQIADLDPLGLMARPMPGVLQRDWYITW